MAVRNIINIDEDKCNGCGQCVVDCAEAALQVVDGKARLIREIYCDGLGACLGSCPTGALTIIQRESDPFDEEATEKHMKQAGRGHVATSCPGTKPAQFEPERGPDSAADAGAELSNWPVQLKLVGTTAPFLKDADLLLAADCTAFAAANFHGRFIRGKKVVIACPKLDDAQYYCEKLTDIFRQNSIRSVTVIRMEVPCCGGLSFVAKQAITDSKKEIPYHEVILGIKGDVLSEGKKPMLPRLQKV
jgi:NAD-dependent dihydropyrimidine dehydrogenase PreA subunit